MVKTNNLSVIFGGKVGVSIDLRFHWVSGPQIVILLVVPRKDLSECCLGEFLYFHK